MCADEPARPRRVVVVGVTGSGKTTFAAALARRLAVPHVELDALYWEAHWTGAEPAVFRARVADAVGADAWVVDGNYSIVRDLVWSRADSLVWLDYPLPLVMARLLWRTATRILRRDVLWAGNHERLGTALCSRDSILLWALTSYPKHQRAYPTLLASPAYAHLRAVRLRSPRQAATWLASTPSPSAQPPAESEALAGAPNAASALPTGPGGS